MEGTKYVVIGIHPIKGRSKFVFESEEEARSFVNGGAPKLYKDYKFSIYQQVTTLLTGEQDK